MAVTCQFTGIEDPLGNHQETKRKLSLTKFIETGVMLKDLNYYSTFERWYKGYTTTSSTLRIDPPWEDGLMESLALPGLRQDVQGGGAQRRRGTGVRFRMSHLLPFWKNSSRLSLNGCRYSFGDSLHTTAICFSLAVKRRWQSDFL